MNAPEGLAVCKALETFTSPLALVLVHMKMIRKMILKAQIFIEYT